MRTFLRLAFVFGLVLVALPAWAQALVMVEVRTAQGAPADGTVTLRPQAGGRAFTCQTQNGGCRLEGVPGGQYTVSFQSGQGSTPPQPAMIPPSGNVTLHVAVP